VPPVALEFFETRVRPVLAEHCYSCHGEQKQQAGLRLDTVDGLRRGTDDGPVLVPGDPTKSKLIHAVKRQGDYPMPPKQALSDEAVAVLTQWVKAGATYPSRAVTKPDLKKSHWAFQPVIDPPVPSTRATAVSPIDRFILARLEARGLALSPAADRRTLIRRAYYDLVGLPPTAAEIGAFERDTSPGAWERLIDRLQASPHYGERWARHWLDVARYADSKGYVFQEDRSYPYAYTYRDYVIRSFNEDKPFDRFIIEQIAADRLPGDDKKILAALGFLTVGRRFMNNVHDVIDDRIDVVTRGFMGLTVQCARCHDHKYDPVPIADYYSLYGVFASTIEPRELPLIGEVERSAEYEKFATELKKRQQELESFQEKQIAVKLAAFGGLAGPAAGFQITNTRRILNRADRNEVTRLQRRIDEFQARSPVAPPRAMAVADSPSPTQPVVFLRGNPGNRGPKVPRQAPAVIAGPDRRPFTSGSGRLELAKAIASPNNPLTARVFVNRVWSHLFGRGLVATPSDFGTRSDPPTHPELLDWLASRFVEDGWSVKKLQKRIMLSDAYRQASHSPPELLTADPENRLLGRRDRRRLDFESFRDGMLLVSGMLDRTLYGRSVELFKAPYPTRRSVYASIDRQNLPGTFRAFDMASPDQHTPQRFVTTVPQQALFLMNNPFVMEQARAVTNQPDVLWARGDKRIRRIYFQVLARSPTDQELALARGFLASVENVPVSWGQIGHWPALAQVLLLSNEFAFVD
jgi:hypothetical protein